MSTEQAPGEQQEQWLQEPPEPELPRRPRRRLSKMGGNPIQLALTGVLLLACGFIGGVLVEKGQSSSGSSAGASGFAARFASLRAAGGGSGTNSAGTSSGSGGRAASFFGDSGGGAGGLGATIGQVAYVSGSTLYVTNAEGNTVKIKTSDASTVSKTVKSDVKGIHPGETVIVTGSPGSGGAVQAGSIRVSEAGAGGDLGALFGGGARGGETHSSGGSSGSGGGTSGSGGGSSGSGGGTPGSGGGEPALFGK